MSLFNAIRYLCENAEFAYRGDPTNEQEYEDSVTWHGPGNKPSWEEVAAVWDEANTFIKLNTIRLKRNSLLFNSDWTQLEDSVVDKNAWALYRQALRDFPENVVDLDNPIWPVAPEL